MGNDPTTSGLQIRRSAALSYDGVTRERFGDQSSPLAISTTSGLSRISRAPSRSVPYVMPYRMHPSCVRLEIGAANWTRTSDPMLMRHLL